MKPNSEGNKIQTIINSNGTAIKFPDGTMICTQRVQRSTVITNKQTAVYGSNEITLPDFPVPFISTPAVQRTLEKDSGMWFCWLTTKQMSSKTNPGSVILVRDSSTTETGTVTVIISVVAIGRWK